MLQTLGLLGLKSDPAGNAFAAGVQAGHRQRSGKQPLQRGVIHYFMRPRREGRRNTYDMYARPN